MWYNDSDWMKNDPKGDFVMKHRALALVLAAALLFGAQTALAQQSTYVFPYEGFRYTQQEDETVLTQTNLDEHAELIASLGTTKEAVLANYIASGIVMEVIPQEGGQIAVSVVSAGAFGDVQSMDELSEERLAAFASQFADSSLYETCEVTATQPVCVRMTSSSMVGSMPVYTLRYATLHLGQLYMLTQAVVGRAPDSGDDARMETVLSGMKLLKTVSEPTAVPTPVPTPTPEPTAVPTPGVAEVIASEGELTVEGVPAFTNDAKISLSGKAAPSAEVTVAVGGETLGTTTAKKDGSYALRVTLPEEGELLLAVMTDEAEQMLSVTYEMPTAALEILEPTEDVFTGTNVVVKGVTEPNATVYVTGKGMSTNVKANASGSFSVRIYMDDAGTNTYTFRASVKGSKDATITRTLTRELTEREGIALFRQKMVEISYNDLLKNPEKYTDKKFIFRGKVAGFTDYDGSPCAVVLVDNVATGVWYDPVWVVLTPEMEVAEGDIVTFYLVGAGQTLPASGEYTQDGAEIEAPVAAAMYISNAK